MNPIIIEKNGNQNITCEAPGTQVSKYLRWMKVTSSGKVEIGQSMTVRRGDKDQGSGKEYELLILMIKNAQKDVGGEYECIRQGHASQPTSKKVTVKFQRKY